LWIRWCWKNLEAWGEALRAWEVTDINGEFSGVASQAAMSGGYQYLTYPRQPERD